MAVDVSWLLSSLEELCVIVGATAKHVHEQLRFRHLVLYGERDGFAEDLESAEETGVDVVGFDIERELVRVGMQLGVRHLAPHVCDALEAELVELHALRSHRVDDEPCRHLQHRHEVVQVR
eukprot:CAMPEP_0175957072 /NCGR_PEP_ID=MMETSP0108-20121206/33447_1 /TAXON_ID=195067 ORGANISM="Goniomonas pacifica, Strain CCMP1869" /NCGR_SAMPLE_ID=MMETSP0108 /ASSEMBLY_ACC=CAM_ASM_000204 /LENGTH=120 /DNA_ID=CAMNT_0017284191 /DNA_START=512 /DNA_END=874 /DNA_ORIENTATION=+